MSKLIVELYRITLNLFFFPFVQKGKKVMICHNVSFKNQRNVSIGDYSFINGGRVVAGKNSTITIGKNCLISYDVHIRTVSHKYKDKNQLIKHQGYDEANIVIGDDVWVGYGVQIMSGITIGEGAVIASGAIVTKDVEPYMVVAGIPAKVISNRV